MNFNPNLQAVLAVVASFTGGSLFFVFLLLPPHAELWPPGPSPDPLYLECEGALIHRLDVSLPNNNPPHPPTPTITTPPAGGSL
ncbi:Peptidase A1 domain-containing protein [Psidium guajava]|nr:Peptidase A1 domain-containing protein [Psidium guajava]